MATHQQNLIANDSENQKKLTLLLSLFTGLIIIFFLWVAYPSKYYFLNDDFEHIPIAANGHFIFGTFVRPVTDILLWFDNKIWDKNAFGYHLTSIFIHFANTILVYFLAKQFLQLYTNGKNLFLKSWAVAILFLIYAFHSEPVFWIICRSGSISAFFFLLACLFYLKRNNGISFFLLALLFFGIGLLTYESTWVYPFIVLFISAADIFLKKRNWKNEWLFPAATFLFFIGYLIWLKIKVGTISTDYTMHNFFHFNISKLFLNYNSLLARTFLPYMNSSALFAVSYCASLIFIAAILFIFYRRKKINILTCLLILSFLISPLPAISLGINTHNSESERYIYLPSVFCIMLIVEIIFGLFNNKKLVAGIIIILLTAHCYLFYKSASAFSFAGDVIKRSLGAINVNSSVNTIHVINRPVQYKGAIMFRSDFENALNWICTDCKYQKIDTVSAFSYPRKTVFKTQELNVEDGLKIIGGIIINTNSENLQINIQGKSFSFQNGKDMILYWTDSSFIKIK